MPSLGSLLLQTGSAPSTRSSGTTGFNRQKKTRVYPSLPASSQVWIARCRDRYDPQPVKRSCQWVTARKATSPRLLPSSAPTRNRIHNLSTLKLVTSRQLDIHTTMLWPWPLTYDLKLLSYVTQVTSSTKIINNKFRKLFSIRYHSTILWRLKMIYAKESKRLTFSLYPVFGLDLEPTE